MQPLGLLSHRALLVLTAERTAGILPARLLSSRGHGEALIRMQRLMMRAREKLGMTLEMMVGVWRGPASSRASDG